MGKDVTVWYHLWTYCKLQF